ncbi:MAG: UDP-3-O-[Elusimicrobiaceae bacterium]|nr:UDP-3-O-[3-hydroxymyristoyl] N-acetylglucosamine deacetylase [Elusimicrobiaceae bacterium]
MRKTIVAPVSVKGIGLHTGAPSVMTFKPAENGIHFVRVDIAGSEPIKADLHHVGSTMRGTNLKNTTAEVWTVEHVLSTLSALGITDILVEMDGPEPPITDGSALVYAQHLQQAGFRELDTDLPQLVLKQPVTYSYGPISYSAEPADELTVTFIYEHKHPLVGKQEYTVALNTENYLQQIAAARTFGFEEELAFLKAHGLAKGGSLENAIVIGKEKYLNELRYADELVRHKILDLVGDFSLIGKKLPPLKITCRMGGHKHNVLFGRLLLANSEEK